MEWSHAITDRYQSSSSHPFRCWQWTIPKDHLQDGRFHRESHALLPGDLYFGGIILLPTTCSLSPSIHCLHLIHIATIPDMGRCPWATPEQLTYLKSYLPSLQLAKKTISLAMLYGQVYDGLIAKWHPEFVTITREPVTPELVTPVDPQAEAKKHVQMVHTTLTCRPCCAYDLPAHCQLV